MKEQVPSFQKKSSSSLGRRQSCPLRAVVTSKVRIINDSFFDLNTARGTKCDLNLDTPTQDIPRYLCGEALPKLLIEIVRLRIKYPLKRILVS